MSYQSQYETATHLLNEFDCYCDRYPFCDKSADEINALMQSRIKSKLLKLNASAVLDAKSDKFAH